MILQACQRFDPNTVPKGWKVEPIKNRLRLEYGSGLTDSNRRDGAYPVFGSNGQVGTHESYLVDAPGILVGRKGSVGEVHFSDRPFWPIDTVYYIRRIGEDNWRYLYYLLGYLNLGQLNAATGLPGLTRRDAHYILGAFPEIHEQDEIAKVLNMADDAITAAEEKLRAARRLKTALMQQLFTRGIPGRHSRFKQTKIGEIPKEWDLSQLRRLFISSTNGHYVPDSEYGSGTPIIRIDTFEDGDFYSRDFDRIRIPNHEIDMFAVKNGDVLFNRVNSIPYVGKVVFVTGLTEPTVFESNMMRLRFDDADLAHYVALALCEPSTKRRIWSMARPAIGQLSINQREVGQFLIPLPKEDERKVIVPLIGAAKETIVVCESEVSALRRIKCSLLQNLLTGKVRVKPLETSL